MYLYMYLIIYSYYNSFRLITLRLGLQLEIFASAMLPGEAQLQQMRQRPWSGAQFSEDFLSSVEGMARETRRALRLFRDLRVEPIIESKVRNDSDLSNLAALLAQEGVVGIARPQIQQLVEKKQSFPAVKRRWGKGMGA